MLAEEKLKALQNYVALQADDESLWSVPVVGKQSVTEALLQQELRRLAWMIEEASVKEIRMEFDSKFALIKDQ